MAILFEKSSQAINYKEVILDVLKRSLFQEIKSNTSCKVVEGQDGFIENFDMPLRTSYKYASEATESLSCFIKDGQQREEYVSFWRGAEKFSSNILLGCAFVKEKGFSFNLQFDTFIIRDLTQAEADDEVAKYKRADGQYVFEGTFLTREKIKEYISAKYGVMMISMRYAVQTFPGSIIEVVFNVKR